MKKNNKKYLLLLILLSISIGFAYLTTELGIIGNASVKGNKWDVYFENPKLTINGVEQTTPTITEKTTINYTVNLNEPGDEAVLIVDAKNAGTIDAMIESFSNLMNDSEISLPDYLDYSVTYIDGVEVANNQLLKVNKKETYKVLIKYKDTIDPDQLDEEDNTFTFKFSVKYRRDDGRGVVVRTPVCKRATTLHTEECERESDGCYADGYTATGSKGTKTITYGNLGTEGTLTSGDAFDCDVNADGTYDPARERFYYVSSKDADEASEYATLIYYNNVRDGVADSTGTSAYNTDGTNGENWHGPTALLSQLPSVSQWTNTKLNTNITRQITNQNGGSTTSGGDLPIFTYTNSATRLLTYQEAKAGCNNSNSVFATKCNYLIENTRYSDNNVTANYWWLETPSSSSDSIVWNIRGSVGDFDNYYVNNSYGVRPAIEVNKMYLDY